MASLSHVTANSQE